MPLTPVTGFATAVGVAALLLGVALLRSPLAVHEVQVAHLGSTRRDDRAVRRRGLSRGLTLVVLGTLCLLFVVLSV